MHVVILVDEERLRHEGPAIRRLIDGLCSRDIRVSTILPEQDGASDGDEREPMGSERQIETPMRVLPWVRRLRTRKLLEPFEKSAPDVVLALGADSWGAAVDLAMALDRPLAIDVHGARLVRRLPRRRDAAAISAYLTPTEALAEHLRLRLPAELVACVPLGIEIPREPRPVLGDDRATLALAILGSGHDTGDYRSLFEGLSNVARRNTGFEAFLELAGPRDHEIWRIAGKYGLLQHISALDDADLFRDLLTGCDALILPEPSLTVRSLVLEAMSGGTVVATVHETMFDVLREPGTCLLTSPDARGWETCLDGILNRRGEARAVGLIGRRAVADRHTTGRELDAMIATLDRVISGGAMPFEQPGARTK